jgi:uncharacterized delta-60 repeat protein
MRISTWFRPLIVRLSRTRPRLHPRRPVFRPCLESLEDRITPSGGGVLDPTFGSGGTVLNSTGTSSQELTDVSVLPDGRLLAGGFMTSASGARDFAAARYNANGTLDTSFGNGGVSLINDGGTAMGVAVQPNSGGKILLGGGVFQVVRLNPDGTLDTTFGPKGSKGLASGGGGTEADSMAVLPNGSFVLAGMLFKTSGSGVLVLNRFNANGTLDTTFGKSGHGLTAGEVVTSISIERALRTDEHAVRVAVDSSGRIIVTATTAGGSFTQDFLVARFNANGSLDTTFGPAHTGVVTTDIQGGSQDTARALAIQSDGKIVVGGSSGLSTEPGALLAMARYNTDGSLDTTFGSGGIVTAVAIPNYYHSGDEILALAIQPDGRIATADRGDYSVTQSDGSIFLSPNLVGAMRFNADGSTDTSYGPSGTGAVLTSFGYNSDVSGAALQPDGRLVVVGEMNTPAPTASDPSPSLEYFALARFLGSAPSPSPVQVGSLTATPNPVAAGSPVTLTAAGVTTANAGATITSVAFYAVNDAGVELLLGYATQNADGTWTLTWTVNLTSGQYTLLALAVDSSGSISDPLAITLEVQ